MGALPWIPFSSRGTQKDHQLLWPMQGLHEGDSCDFHKDTGTGRQGWGNAVEYVKEWWTSNLGRTLWKPLEEREVSIQAQLPCADPIPTSQAATNQVLRNNEKMREKAKLA